MREEWEPWVESEPGVDGVWEHWLYLGCDE